MQKLAIALLAVLAVGGITLGNAMAIQFNESITADADGPTSVIIKADSGQPNILFSDVGSSIYQFGILDGQGVFTIGDVNAGLARLGIDSTGNIGIGTVNPDEKLHVIGNIKLTGDIVSDNDICIGTCP